ncbi:MAG: rhomboid family intramembrane serine protease [Lachnospiraceae bacterium]|nr:rhomboid family intramembrane serine protease [Lachnospiraceae bacterium]
MNKFLDKLERKYGKYAINGLIRYFLVIYIAGAVIGLYQDGAIYYNFLCLDIAKVLRGQVWRLVTYLIEPYGFSSLGAGGFILNAIFFFFSCNIIYLFGTSLEDIWGPFKFNLYFLTGWLLNIIAAFILYFVVGVSVYNAGFQYIYWAMFFAFAMYYPDMGLSIWGIIPVKVKWLAWLDGAYLGYEIIRWIFYAVKAFSLGYPEYGRAYIGMAVAIIVSLLNFLIFFLLFRNNKVGTRKQRKRKREYIRKTTPQKGNTRHRCAVCGRTEADNPDLEFRFCSKCEGNYEYCSDHLFTHIHK